LGYFFDLDSAFEDEFMEERSDDVPQEREFY